MRSGTVWSFETAQFEVSLQIFRDRLYHYDGDDENGETQAAFDTGDYVAFDSTVTVTIKATNEIIGRSSLGASVYSAIAYHEFWTAHRDSGEMNRNCSLMRKMRGSNVRFCHYFPGMVTEAIAEARAYLNKIPRVRAA